MAWARVTAMEEDISKMMMMIKKRRKSVGESREGYACVRCEFGYKSHSD